MTDYTIRPLVPGTWDGFARLMERHNGVFGGCWCTYFHTMSAEKERTYDANRALKCRLVDEGRAHAALAFHADEVVAWCQYGAPDELPNIYHRKQYEEELDVLPDYRITCIFVDKAYRRKGLSAVVLRGALDLIADAGGGIVEGYPHDNAARRSRSSTTGPGRCSSGPASTTSAARGPATASCAARCPDQVARRTARLSRAPWVGRVRRTTRCRNTSRYSGDGMPQERREGAVAVVGRGLRRVRGHRRALLRDVARGRRRGA